MQRPGRPYQYIHSKDVRENLLALFLVVAVPPLAFALALRFAPLAPFALVVPFVFVVPIVLIPIFPGSVVIFLVIFGAILVQLVFLRQLGSQLEMIFYDGEKCSLRTKPQETRTFWEPNRHPRLCLL